MKKYNQDGFDMDKNGWGENRRKGCGNDQCGGNRRQERERTVWNERLIIDQPECGRDQRNGYQPYVADDTCRGCSIRHERTDDGCWQNEYRAEATAQRRHDGAGQWTECDGCSRDDDDELTWDVRYRRHGGHDVPAHTHYFEGYTSEECGHRHYVHGRTERECPDD